MPLSRWHKWHRCAALSKIAARVIIGEFNVEAMDLLHIGTYVTVCGNNCCGIGFLRLTSMERLG